MEKEHQPNLFNINYTFNTSQKFIFEHPDLVSTLDFTVKFSVDEMKDLKQKRTILEQLKCNDSYKELLKQVENSEQPLGTIFKEFLNNIEEISSLLKSAKKDILYNPISYSKDSEEYGAINILKQLCIKLKNCSNLKNCSILIQNEIYTFIKKDLQSTKRLYQTEEKLKAELSNYKFYQNECIKFLDNFTTKILFLKQTTESSFIKKKVNTDESSYNLPYKFNMTALTLPIVNLHFDKKSKYTIFEYTYKICTLEDLMNITIYHLMLNNTPLVKCKVCKNFFVAIRNNMIYCNDTIWGTRKNGTNIMCKNKANENYHTQKEPQYKKDYNKIYNKIKKFLNSQKINSKENKKIKEDLQMKFKVFTNKYKDLSKNYKFAKRDLTYEKNLYNLFSKMNKDYELTKEKIDNKNL